MITPAELREVPLFAGVSDAALERIAGCAGEVEVEAGQVLALSSEAGSGMFVLLDGRVVVELGEATRELEPPNFFGELSLLVPEAKRIARIRAAEHCRCLAVPRAEFLELLETEPGLALPMLREIARRMLDLPIG